MKKVKTIRVLVKQPGKSIHVEYVRNTLEDFQNIVGGYIEAVTVASDLAVICNEEGRINGMPYNCRVRGVPFYGPIAFVGVREDQFTGCPFINPDLWIEGGDDE